MRKTLSLVLVSTMMAAMLAGCGGGGSSAAPETTAAPTTTAAEAAKPEAPADGGETEAEAEAPAESFEPATLRLWLLVTLIFLRLVMVHMPFVRKVKQ